MLQNKLIFFVVTSLLISCSDTEIENKPFHTNVLEVNHRFNEVLAYLASKKIKVSDSPIHIYFFTENTCMSCNKEKFENCIRLLSTTRVKSIVVYNNNDSISNDISNENVTFFLEDPNALNKKGLKFMSPCLYILSKDKQELIEIDTYFLDSISKLNSKSIINYSPK